MIDASRAAHSWITVLTHIPSPYQVELFDALDSGLKGRLRVVYLKRTSRGRQWLNAHISHVHCYLNEGGLRKAQEWVQHAELVVFNGYRGRSTQRLIELRRRTGGAWAFWGERPGANTSGWIGRSFRAFGQRRIRSAGVPLWGIGAWAVEEYKKEIGGDRLYLNVPYFSNLDRFLAINRSNEPVAQPVRFLYSGSLIERKGVDLLAQAFTRLVSAGVDARLTFLGSGPLEHALRKATSSIASKIEFLGFRQWQELPTVYAQADVLCAPSRYDGWGLIVPEGLAAGMPVIATDMMGAARELITQQNGWLIRADDVEALYRALREAACQTSAAQARAPGAARKSAKAQNLAVGLDRIKEAMAQSIAECARLGLSRDHAV
jgi:glycosyltransferase involved in cell wall biosynthesis